MDSEDQLMRDIWCDLAKRFNQATKILLRIKPANEKKNASGKSNLAKCLMVLPE